MYGVIGVVAAFPLGKRRTLFNPGGTILYVAPRTNLQYIRSLLSMIVSFILMFRPVTRIDHNAHQVTRNTHVPQVNSIHSNINHTRTQRKHNPDTTQEKQRPRQTIRLPPIANTPPFNLDLFAGCAPNHFSAIGLACILTCLMMISLTGLSFFPTGAFSITSNTSNPSMT